MARLGKGTKQPASVPKPKALPRWPRPRVTHYGPQRMFQIEDAHDALERRATPDPTPQGTGTVHERIVYKELTRRGIPFVYQSSVEGGRTQKGGRVVDFVLSDRPIAIEVKGFVWHPDATLDMAREIELSEVLNAYIVTLWDYEIEDEQEFQRIMDERVTNVLPTIGMMEGGLAIMPAPLDPNDLRLLKEAIEDAKRRLDELEGALYGGVNKPFKISAATIIGITAEQISTGTLQAATEINAGYRIGGGVTLSGDGSVQARTLEGVPFFVAHGEHRYVKIGLRPEESEGLGDYLQLYQTALTGIITSLTVRENFVVDDVTANALRVVEILPQAEQNQITIRGNVSFPLGDSTMFVSQDILDVSAYDIDAAAIISLVQMKFGEDDRGLYFADVDAGRTGQVAYRTTGIDIDNCENEFVLTDLTVNGGDRGAIQFINDSGWKLWYDADAAWYAQPWWQPAYTFGPSFLVDNVDIFGAWILETHAAGSEDAYSVPWALHPDVCYLKSRVGIGFVYSGALPVGDTSLTWDGMASAPLPPANTDRDAGNYIVSVKIVSDNAATRTYSIRDGADTEILSVTQTAATSASWAANLNVGISPRRITGNTVQVVAVAGAGQPTNARALVGVA